MRSGGMFASAWSSASRCCATTPRNSSGLRSAKTVLRPVGEVGTVHLNDEAGRRDDLVFVLHDVGQRIEVGLVRWVVVVVEEARDDAGGRSRHESLFDVRLPNGVTGWIEADTAAEV